ncbi:hypothetical protein ACJIZ3_001729 [Penstemon smallii]|uniref:Uncharacterized protein n=1 Tax=Penstemon smallii TaxID=265156 RepID=A0ABD3U4G8_9LAMI
MADKSKKRKKGSISEEDTSNLLERYSVDTVLSLLQEVEQFAEEKMDWNELVKNTATGISSAKEYQMLWRHLAYAKSLIDQSENDENPMDDDSDLEYELEPFPAVSREASAEAAAYVKVLIASGSLNDSHVPINSTIEAPLTINVPSIRASTAPSDSSHLPNAMQGTNISIPVYVQKQPLSSGTCGEKRPINETPEVNLPPRRKRRGWSTQEDTKLTAAVQKYGERNWVSIAGGDFNNDRKASELSQRWANIRKKQGNSNVGTSSHLPETQLAAAHRAMSLALDMPMGDHSKASSHISSASVGLKSQRQVQEASRSMQNHQSGTTGPSKSQVPLKRPSVSPTQGPDSMLKAAAVAAGARIATSAAATSLIEAARSQNVVHIKTGVNPVTKTSTTSITNQLPSNVHFIRNGLTKAPISAQSSTKPNISRPGEAQQAQGQSIKPTAPAVQPNPVGSAPVPNVSSSASGLSKVAEDAAVSTPAKEIKELSQRDQGPVGNQSEKVERHQTSTSEVKDNEETTADNQCTSQEIHENHGPSGRQKDLLSTSKVSSVKTEAT